jgi:hypothetical protein
MTSPQTIIQSPMATSWIGGLWRRLEARLRPAPIATTDALRIFLEERAALIAQKCAIDYCRGKTGLASYALFTEKPFLDALDVCRWETYAAVLGDLLIVVEGHLRPHAAGQHARLCEALVGLYSAASGKETFVARFQAASRGGPQAALDVADHSAQRLFETLPIHSSYRELDEEVVYGAVRFRMIAVSAEMQRRLAAAELVRQLLA